jgi:hypothetical protein
MQCGTTSVKIVSDDAIDATRRWALLMTTRTANGSAGHNNLGRGQGI